MWDESKQTRLDQLCEVEAQGALTEVERAELAALTSERCHYEETAIQKATRRTQEENARLEARVQQAQAQNRELEALIREQEAYLAEVQALIAQMEEHRRNWRARYTQVTGKPLREPITVEGGH